MKMNNFDGPCPEKMSDSRLPDVPLCSPQGAACYQEGKRTFPLQRPRGALHNAEEAHWIARRNLW